MENLVNDLDIKQEDDDANNEKYSTKIIAAKIYSIAELMDNTDADISQEYRGVHPEKSGEEENVYDNLFEVKEEDLELSSSDNLDTDEDVNVQPTHDSASASMPFRGHIAQIYNGNDLKQSKDDKRHTDADCEVHLLKRELYPEKSVEEENLYDNLFEVKEEDLELSSSDNLESDEADDSASGNISFGQHVEQDAKSELQYSLLCPFCGLEFSDQPEWRHHLNLVHNFHKRESLNMLFTNDTISCLECKAEIKSKLTTGLQRHRIVHLPYNQYVKCKLCDKRFIRSAYHKRHFLNCHNKQNPQKTMKRKINEDLSNSEVNCILLCPFCGLEFSDQPEWRHHLNLVHNFHKRESLNMLYTRDTISCLECKVEIKSKLTTSLQKHRIAHLPYNRYFKCKLCHKIFNCSSNHKRHFLKSHNTLNPRNPQKCRKRMKNEDLSNSEANFTLLCPFCGLEFPDHFVWREHLENVHDFNKVDTLNMEFVGYSIKCRDCEKTMIGRGIASLETHRIGHLPYNLYVKCKLCNKCFQTVRSHKKHIIRCHNENRNDPNIIVLCPFCGKEFPDSIVWRVHLNVNHEFDKLETLNMDFTKGKSKCQECNIELKSKSTCQLQQHRILHLPYKRFVKCKLCEELFYTKSKYRSHIVRCKRK